MGGNHNTQMVKGFLGSLEVVTVDVGVDAESARSSDVGGIRGPSAIVSLRA